MVFNVFLRKFKIKNFKVDVPSYLYLEDTSHIYKKKSKKKEKDPEAARDISRSFTKPVTESVTQTSTYTAPTVKVIKRHYYVELLLVLDNTVYEAWVVIIFSDTNNHYGISGDKLPRRKAIVHQICCSPPTLNYHPHT